MEAGSWVITADAALWWVSKWFLSSEFIHFVPFKGVVCRRPPGISNSVQVLRRAPNFCQPGGIHYFFIFFFYWSLKKLCSEAAWNSVFWIYYQEHMSLEFISPICHNLIPFSQSLKPLGQSNSKMGQRLWTNPVPIHSTYFIPDPGRHEEWIWE